MLSFLSSLKFEFLISSECLVSELRWSKTPLFGKYLFIFFCGNFRNIGQQNSVNWKIIKSVYSHRVQPVNNTAPLFAKNLFIFELFSVKLKQLAAKGCKLKRHNWHINISTMTPCERNLSKFEFLNETNSWLKSDVAFQKASVASPIMVSIVFFWDPWFQLLSQCVVKFRFASVSMLVKCISPEGMLITSRASWHKLPSMLMISFIIFRQKKIRC